MNFGMGKADRMSAIFIKKWYILMLVITVIVIYLIMLWSYQAKPVLLAPNRNRFLPIKDLVSGYNQDWLVETCTKNKMDLSIKNLAGFVEKWELSSDPLCSQLYKKFSAIYSIEKNAAPLKLPDLFQVKVKKWLNNDEKLFEEVYHQEVTGIYNKWTREHTIFNPLREKRPVSIPEEPENIYVNRLVEKSKVSCDFCRYKDYTAEDTFGRLDSVHAFSASNAFKLERYHDLFALKSHHPHQWNIDQYMDLMNLTQKWFALIHTIEPDFCCPSLVWDILPRAGASQIHPHMHGLVGQNRYHGGVENWRRGADDYYSFYHSNYFSDLIQVNTALGLTVQHGDAIAFANIVPKKDNEVVIISNKASQSFFQLIYYVMRAFIDDMDKLAISMGIGCPSLDHNAKQMPAVARIVTRGAVADVRTDMSSLELFSVTNVNIDPFKVIKHIRNSVEKRASK
ncbi:uncharacterized protein LOC126826813 [Patella vulgata]|uniref:uncharacterized protein LOC126826813 n=1 Tax=Patella vulgata TaxID=6465 RepID=UPI00217FDFF1|nr:uncharacterized protein LOC126826813 [Patella vulgata]